MANLHLTKSRTIAGLQCLRRLWLLVHEPLDYEESDAGSPLAMGYEIGRHAHKLFPGGVLVAEEPWQHAQAVARTAALMADAAVPAVFEAAFVHDDIRIRVDVMERTRDGWGLREVKSSTGVKAHHLDDVALQRHVLAGAGVPVTSAEVLHVNTGYLRGPGEVDWPAFFTRVDVAGAIKARQDDLLPRLPPMRTCLQGDSPPLVEPGGHCHTPYGCEFWERCTADKPDDWITRLPRLTPARRQELEALGIHAISAIPAGFPLTSKQAIIRDATASGQPYVAPGLAGLLRRFSPPACYLDFEAMMPPVPLYEGTRPYQTLPFQWSLHTAAADGTLTHAAFLASGTDDPRRAFAETLIAALGGSGLPIVVYSAYEQTQLRELARQMPDLAPALEAIIGRLADLLPVVRSAVYLPEFGFSNSIKAVAPALAPGFGYDDLPGIADGAAAAAGFLQLASGGLSPSARASVRTELLAYCERDTMAMVEVHRALVQLSSLQADPG